MKISLNENLSAFDRTMRITIGICLVMSILVMPYQSALIAAISLVAAYPLLSGLTAIDPVIAVAESISFKSIFEHKAGHVGRI